MNKKAFLIILDGWGHGPNPQVSAIAQAKTPYVDSLYQQYPNAELTTFGADVGLPTGQMGNSEVGHLNIGAGRIVYQELARINKEIEDQTIDHNPAIEGLIQYARSNNKAVHLLGLLSDGGVHSHIDHIIYLSNLLSRHKIKHYIHAFLDGRDTDPNGGIKYIERFVDQTNDEYCMLSSIVGRYYAMDRDKRWERIKIAYDLLVHGKGTVSQNPIESLQQQYDEGITDEFMNPIKLMGHDQGIVSDDDAVLFANFRTDRPRQITEVLSQSDFEEYEMVKRALHYVTMTAYDESFENVHIVFEKENIKNTLGEVISKNNLTQLRIAETEKYPHVTFFFSGGIEKAMENEHRILINSPKVATYDLMPEMSAPQMTKEVMDYIQEDAPDFIILNYANADMVGHTGVFEAAVKAAEVLDGCLSELIELAKSTGYFTIIIADHGNSDCMINPDGSPHTAHTMNPVPIIIIDPEKKVKSVKNGKLADIAPTILHHMGVDIPKDMTGDIIA
ncbi:MAG: 2,3-bisphosphoglycerate-independent phosphoglycerate mutase [Saprospiraceae bacterium]|nr:2,3-bisphosphoglycerate-independent phosphoglycerate mutase [Saprospiraceae bacterium]